MSSSEGGAESSAGPVEVSDEVRATFEKFSRDGVIAATEVRACVVDLGLAVDLDDVEALLILYDSDKNGTIELSELQVIADDIDELKERHEEDAWKAQHGELERPFSEKPFLQKMQQKERELVQRRIEESERGAHTGRSADG